VNDISIDHRVIEQGSLEEIPKDIVLILRDLAEDGLFLQLSIGGVFNSSCHLLHVQPAEEN